MDALTAKFVEGAGRPPQEKEIQVENGSLFVYRGAHPTGRWYPLGPPEMPGFTGAEQAQFEIRPGIVLTGPPAFIVQTVLQADYGASAKDADDLVQFIFKVIKGAGWKGSMETDVEAVPGTVVVDDGFPVDLPDIRPVLTQLQAPDFNGWLSIVQADGVTFVNVGRSNKIRVYRREMPSEK